MNENNWEPFGFISTEGKVSCAERLREALNIRNMKQSDLCRITNIPQSAMSQYINGAFEPKQDRVELIAKALDVSEAWLMGYAGVPMTRGKEPGEAGYGYFLWLEEQRRLEKPDSDNNETEQYNFCVETLKRIIDTMSYADCKKLLKIIRAVFYEDTESDTE